MKKALGTELPEHIKKFFWDIDCQKLDFEKHKSSIIGRTLKYGSLDDWQWLTSQYGNQEIIKSVGNLREGYFYPSTIKLISLLIS